MRTRRSSRRWIPLRRPTTRGRRPSRRSQEADDATTKALEDQEIQEVWEQRYWEQTTALKAKLALAIKAAKEQDVKAEIALAMKAAKEQDV